MIVFFSDVHANLPALKAFFKEMDTLKPDAIYCLGDLVGYHVWPGEVVDEIRKRQIPTILGNHDEAQLKYIDPTDQSNRGITSRLLSNDQKVYLSRLPRHIKLDFETFSMLLVHGSPRKINEYLKEDHDSDDLKQLFQENDTDIIICGHTHLPYVRHLQTEKGNKIIVNTGSVGRPKDGDYRGSYVVMDVIDGKPKFEVKRFDYDLEKSVQALMESDFDKSYVDVLRQKN
ncbi:metallophosphoesterase family protein [Jiulongibacter sp. NS-SX5]|uniref:metallophosphoesterase family protein n=1 Tax=Jiulongibacter sp. NS-SX5 TaxID=3463854 RepID=UPI004058FDD2